MRNLSLGFVVACSIVVAVAAKMPTVKLTIAGPNLAKPIELTDPKALLSGDVWEGNFIAAPAAEPDKALPRYAVSFYVAGSKEGEPAKIRYVVYYTRDPGSGDGYVYLPGPGEEWYRLNIGAILREGVDGKWHHASKNWSDAIAAALP